MLTRRRTKTSKAWTQGFVTAAALIMRTHHQRDVAMDVARAAIGHGPEGLRVALAREGASEYDLLALDGAFRDSPREKEWFGNA